MYLFNNNTYIRNDINNIIYLYYKIMEKNTAENFIENFISANL